jgi:hypothetical protein
VFWSHALTNQSAARAAGREPPITQPGLGQLGQQVDDLGGVGWRVGQDLAETGP